MSTQGSVKNRRPPKQVRIDEIVRAAREVFRESGYDDASIAEIARRAGVAEGTIYTHFDGKRSLLYEVLRRHYAIIFADIDRTLPGISGQANRLRFLVMRALDAIAGDRAMCRLITCELRQSGENDQSVLHDLNRHYAQVMAEILEAGKQDGSFRSDMSISIVRDLICGGMELMAWSYMITGRTINVERVTDSLLGTLLNGIGTQQQNQESLGKLVERLERVADRIDIEADEDRS